MIILTKWGGIRVVNDIGLINNYFYKINEILSEVRTVMNGISKSLNLVQLPML
jgi:hypothetical protein